MHEPINTEKQELKDDAQLDIDEELFSKIFLVNELQWLLWAFGDNINNKRKKNLIPLILKHLKKGTFFSKEAISKGQIFAGSYYFSKNSQ
ncbi:hypothetical protein RhiirA5_506906 [Rhizophagus irregularis]|uniref:Uncharacterized protein n=1 Tax=Rhizophagus irregularis TaxID=588596 RepID=A0A2N0NPU0_9GLOM|nr:hypothetical protein RhiirA5_506906 [Rhizophagus irregularis]